jgi:hypothetical protein
VEKKGGGGFDGGHVLGGVRRGGVPLARVEEEAPAGDQDPPAAGMGGTAMLGTRQERGGYTNMWAPRPQWRVLNQPSNQLKHAQIYFK